ncbi:MAG: hypothetical protein JWR09_96 [Mucilaginibacter sp.]|nr:hypothetical protein [Mucilaginibacter sp.]
MKIIFPDQAWEDYFILAKYGYFSLKIELIISG